ncbi:AraC family transcriptional regulator [Bradyrhizobium sp. LHD-71]|uniref:AraC family transcriptional regulator n=1 Tax=Bradyrhizobium sp. LHD-71 TaxID=3072141 RepID=UPI00280C6413|nr:AraC family transcriptional regulator [Bradyrhizobium sp. LHD-71]MDQ8729734.1 AraC family transcriptional regulator [Bradyrhizobium sp. LHD-71]
MAKPLSFVRAGTLAGYVDLARTLQLDAFALLKSVGLHRFDLSDVDTLIPASAVSELLERSADAADIEDFGLRLAVIRSLAHIGPVGLLVREEPTVGDAIRAAERYLHRYSDAMEFRLEEHADLAMLRVQFLATTRGDTRQATELLVGTVHRVINALAGSAWAAESISFSHPAPSSRTIHNTFFRTRTLFDNVFNGFIMRRADLIVPIRTAEMAMPRYMKQFVEEVVAHPTVTIDATVRQLIFSLLPSGRCTSEAVASHLGVDRKTVNRRLAVRGVTFSEILNDVRIELARRHIRTGHRSLTETAQLLGFSGLATFSRWFRTEFGTSATCWRRSEIGRDDGIKPQRSKPAGLPRRVADSRRRPRAAR